MNRIVYLCVFLITILSCSKEPQEVFIEYVVQGVLETDKDTQRIKVTQTGFGELGIEGAQVFLKHTSNTYMFSDVGGGYYESTSGEIDIEPEGFYVLEVFIDDITLRSTTTVPPEVSLENQSDAEFFVDLNTAGEIVYFCNWLYEGDFSQVLTLTSVEEDQNPIPFVNDLIDFNESNTDPIPTKSVILKDLNFPYYGNYELIVNVINKQYEAVYFNDLVNGENNPPEGIDNIEGGKGFFTSTSRLIVDLEILE